MTSGFERFAAAAREHPTLRGMVAGELIRSEVEVRTGKCDSFAEAADAMARRRVDLLDVADDLGYRLCAAGTHPYSRWQDQQVIDTPHYRDRRVDAALRGLAQQHVRPARPRRHPRRRPRDRRQQRASHGAARAAGLLRQLAVAGGAPHAPALDAHRDLHQVLPALRHPRQLRRLGRVRGVRPLPDRRRARSASTPRSGGACARTRPIPPSRRGSATGSPSSRARWRWPG